MFGKSPDATIVDSSLWDVWHWWMKRDFPDWDVPRAEISHWCHQDIPKLLNFVQKSMPDSHIAFRTPPPRLKTCGDPHYPTYCRPQEIIDEMCSCLWKSTSAAPHLLDDKYPLIDYYKVVQDFYLKHRDVPRWHTMSGLYRDGIHPVREVGLAYVAEAFRWLKSLSSSKVKA